jgi:hypothetical protein
MTHNLRIRENLFQNYDLDKTVVSSHSSLVEAMVSFLTADGEPSFQHSLHNSIHSSFTAGELAN